MNNEHLEAKAQYNEYAMVLLKLWCEKLLTDGEYNKIMDRINSKYEYLKENNDYQSSL